MLTYPRFYFLTPALDASEPVEVVCAHTEHNLNMLFNIRRLNAGISFIRVNEADAYKLLVEKDGIGVGCYARPNSTIEDAMRCKMAKFKHQTFRDYYQRGFNVYEPVAINQPQERMTRAVLMTLFARP